MRDGLFVSYSHRDRRWRDRLAVHLKPLERAGVFKRWDDTELEAGDVWADHIEQAIASARVAILLVSADFLASDFINARELPPLLEAAERDEARLMAIILSESLYADTPALAKFQSVNPPSDPVDRMKKADQESVFRQAAQAVARAFSPQPDR